MTVEIRSNVLPDFTEAICERVRNYCLLGASNNRLEQFLDLPNGTLPNYAERFPQLREAIRAGREDADAAVAHSLFARATGYSHTAIKIFRSKVSELLPDGTRIDSYETVTVPYVEHYPPDVNAAIFWLKNRQPNTWRDRIEIDPGASDGDIEFTMKIGNADGSTTIDQPAEAEGHVSTAVAIQETS